MYLTERIEDVIIILMLPLYFVASGLKTDLGDLNTGVCIYLFCVLLLILHRNLGEFAFW